MKAVSKGFIAAFLALSCNPAIAAEPAVNPAASYALPETETWDMTAKSGQTYRIFVSRPAASGEAYPVLYVLDANAMFGAFAEARRLQGAGDSGIDKMIVVGIGYPDDQLYNPLRMRDFTAPIETPALKRLYANYPSGGRDQFAAFLLSELRPAINKRYAANAERQALYGHSLGGLFALHLLYTQPGAFRTVIAASPSIWWDNQAILTEEAAYRTRLATNPAAARGTRLLLIAGEHEERGSIVGDTIAIGKRMEALSGSGLRTEVMVLDGETHVSVPHRSVTAALRAAINWP